MAAEVAYRGFNGGIHALEEVASKVVQYEHDLEDGVKCWVHKHKKIDHRLFEDLPLYCEGMERPTCRGALHMLSSLLFLPFALWFLLKEANGNRAGEVAAVLYIASNFWSYGVSAMYHMGRCFSARTEIVLQKLDHAGIAVFAAGTNLPVAILLLPSHLGFALGFLSIVSCAWACWSIYRKRPGVWRLAVVASVISLFWIPLWYYMNSIEFWCMIFTGVFQGVGTAIFVNKWPNPWPQVFGYHEVFHVFTLLGMTCIFLCNWSVIHRTCNPYARHTDIVELMFVFYTGHFNN